MLVKQESQSSRLKRTIFSGHNGHAEMAATCAAFHAIQCSIKIPSLLNNIDEVKGKLFSAFKPISRRLNLPSTQLDLSKTLSKYTVHLLESFVNATHEFIDQPLLPSQLNFAPVEELKEAISITSVTGEIPDSFPEGVYIRNGPNPLFGGRKSTKSVFGNAREIWVEGEGMLHAMYFKKNGAGSWNVVYKNRHVETETYNIEKQRNKPLFLPAVEGDSLAILSAYLLNTLRYGKVYKYISNTSVLTHSGKCYSIAENYIPQEFDILTLQTKGNWDVNGQWKRPFASHPKTDPDSGELIIMGVDAAKPFVEVGIISGDGKKLIRKVDLKLNRCSLCHEIGITKRYNVIMDFPLTTDLRRLMSGGPLIQYNKDEYARIGVMPRYGDAESVQWFDVEPNCTFHLINSFEDEDEEQVVVWGCRALESVIPGPGPGYNKFDHLSRCYEWRLNTRTGDVRERYLTDADIFMDFPFINTKFTGVKNRYGYTQVIDHIASSISGMHKYGGLAKLYFEETPHTEFSLEDKQLEDVPKVEYHSFEKNMYCSGAVFTPKEGGVLEDDGWIVAFVHNEDTNISQVYIIDAKKFSSEPTAKITLPRRVPYGFHGAYMPISFSSKY